MSKVTSLSRIQEFLEDAIVRRPEILMLAFKKKDIWTTAIARDGEECYPFGEMIGQLEILKAELVDHYVEDTEILAHKTLHRGDDPEN